MQVLGHYKVVLDGTWWYWLSRGRYWLIFGGTVSKWGCTGWYLVVLGHYNLVLLGIKWYWASKGLLCLYILKKKKMKIWSGVTIAGRTTNDEQGKIGLVSHIG